MRKLLSVILLLLLSAFQQAPETGNLVRHDTRSYHLVFDTATRVPVLVYYKLYKGGGSCSRASMSFTVGDGTGSSKDYAKSGYDEGHMANAEDFAGDCEALRSTFTYYNCAPQRPGLNRGVWMSYESAVRAASQSDSLLVMMGSFVSHRQEPVLMGRVTVPQAYWKVVQSLSTGKILFSVVFLNQQKPIVLQDYNMWRAQRMCPLPLPLKEFPQQP